MFKVFNLCVLAVLAALGYSFCEQYLLAPLGVPFVYESAAHYFLGFGLGFLAHKYYED